MAAINLTDTGFLIVGFSDYPRAKVPLFTFFLLIYLITLAANSVIIGTICRSSKLHTPMYFFLANMSLLENIYTSISFPKMLVNFFRGMTRVPLAACLLQSYFCMSMICTEFILLTAMAYDRYVAICNPLHYTAIMNKAACLQLSAAAWIGGLLDPVVHIFLISKLSFCGSNVINHFLCDMTALLMLSCSSTQIIETLTFTIALTIIMALFILTLTSYVYIIAAILKIRSSEGRRKTFSTCASHLTVVLLFYGAVFIMYVRPTSSHSPKYDKIFSFLYIAAVPLCNPFIYSLKNKELKNALFGNINKSG
ncbi:olfactory receptor 5AN6-like [Lissotriton helveticus]